MKTGSKRNLVTIKGTKDGLTILLDDQCSFEALMEELTEKVADKQAFGNGPEVEVKVDTGYRYLQEDHRNKIQQIIEGTGVIKIQDIISQVISTEEAEKMKEESSITSIARIIRSGQVLRIQGDALLLGDINPGGTVEATGNVFVMGTLKGTVRAGVDGNEDTVICASVMEPNQLSIGNTIYYAPDRYEDEKDNEYTNEEPVYAYIHRETKEVAFEKTRQLGQLYPHVANGTFEGL